MSPAEGKRAPSAIQRIVKAVLQYDSMMGVQIAPANNYNRAVEMADGRPPVATVRKFLLAYWTDLEVGKPDPEVRNYSKHLYVMKPVIKPRHCLYVKFTLKINEDNEAASHLTIVRFHPAIGSEPIDRIPEV